MYLGTDFESFKESARERERERKSIKWGIVSSNILGFTVLEIRHASIFENSVVSDQLVHHIVSRTHSMSLRYFFEPKPAWRYQWPKQFPNEIYEIPTVFACEIFKDAK